MSVLKINSLKKTYDNGTQALKGVDLTIKTGMYGLLGPNGAGKSTLMKTIATLQEPDEGTIFLNDLDVLKEKHEVRKILGFLPQEFDVYPKATAYELLNHLAVLKGVTDSGVRKETINVLLEKTNLIHAKNKHLGGFSGGMKQRFGIAQALIGNPQLLIVDEPTAGLDPEERFRFHNILSELGENIIVILSTHIVEDVTELCNSMAIINQGQVIIESHPENVLSNLKGKIWKKVIDKNQIDEIEKTFKVISSRMYMGKTMVHIWAETDPGNDFIHIEPDLEDAYFYYIHTNQLKV
ncbi:MAG: ABC transporter ATP-binding protein [Candidatus Cloacimonetes bacterium]|jgi:ABC-type multidrug transport system ATPase subunit|nr:ABC transporter ATP-binding protein [Candidatus Cloacimonadota bacterium]MDD4157219.1 ABC transporter ATP-binding protein [Candidatus Cloacimonadota bacterium]